MSTLLIWDEFLWIIYFWNSKLIYRQLKEKGWFLISFFKCSNHISFFMIFVKYSDFLGHYFSTFCIWLNSRCVVLSFGSIIFGLHVYGCIQMQGQNFFKFYFIYYFLKKNIPLAILPWKYIQPSCRKATRRICLQLSQKNNNTVVSIPFYWSALSTRPISLVFSKTAE